MSRKKLLVIYCRYSSDMQRADSCADQERAVRTCLLRYGIDLTQFEVVVIYDEAESGTKTARDGFRQLCEMVQRGEVAILVVDDQSRLTRAENAFAFIQDLVFAGGRFISTGEGIDTLAAGWELKVQVLQLHHGQTVGDLQHRVHRGQQGGSRPVQRSQGSPHVEVRLALSAGASDDCQLQIHRHLGLGANDDRS